MALCPHRFHQRLVLDLVFGEYVEHRDPYRGSDWFGCDGAMDRPPLPPLDARLVDLEHLTVGDEIRRPDGRTTVRVTDIRTPGAGATLVVTTEPLFVFQASADMQVWVIS